MNAQRSDAGMGGEGGEGSPSVPVSGQGGQGELGGAGGATPLPTGASVREVLGLPTALALAVVCGAPSAGARLLVFNNSDTSLTIDEVTFEGPFELKTKLPLTVEPGQPQALEVATAAGVVGTDKPGDERSGSVSLLSSIGSVSVALLATVQGTTVSVDGIPGAPLAGPIAFNCLSTGDTCPTHTFNVVNTGTSPLKLSAPVGETAVVAAFVPGSAEHTLQPGAAVKVEVRAAAGASVSQPGSDSLELAVEGSCEVSKLSIATSVVSSDPCICDGVSPGVEAGPFNASFTCRDASSFEVPLFNGSATDVVVSGVDGEAVAAPAQLPLTLERGKTTWLELLPPALAYPGSSVTSLFLTTDAGSLTVGGSLQATGSRLQLLNAQGSSLPSPLQLACASTVLQLWNHGNAAATVAPPLQSGAVVTDFLTAQTIEPATGFTFHVSALSNGSNSCATSGSIAFSDFQNDCSGTGITVNTDYSGSCSCNGL